MLTEQQKNARAGGKTEEFSIDMVSALKGSEYEAKAELLAKELQKVSINYPDQITNAPIKLRVTYGVDIQAVVELVQAYYSSNRKKTIFEKVPEPAPKAKVKKAAK